MRFTVTGYREVTLASELAAARSALAAAGIGADLPHALDDAPGERRELFGWVVREGVTNVVRHSGASRCVVSITPRSVEILDDGRGPGAEAGSGLRGLHERIVTAGGALTTGPRAGGGFRLCAEIPA